MTIEDEGAHGHVFKLFGTRLRQMLEERNMSQVELATRIGKTTRIVSMYLAGERTPRADVLTRIAEVLGTTTDYLCIGTQPGLGIFKDEIKNIAGMAAALSPRDLKTLEDFTWSLKYGDAQVRLLLERTLEAFKLLTQDRIAYNEYLFERKIPRRLEEMKKDKATQTAPNTR